MENPIKLMILGAHPYFWKHPNSLFKHKNLSKSEVSPTPLLAEQLFDGKRFLQIFHYFSQNALQRKRYRGKMGGGVVLSTLMVQKSPKKTTTENWMVYKTLVNNGPIQQ